MINLIKNELSKIFHKKGLYIFGFIILFVLVLEVVINKIDFNMDSFSNTYYKNLEEHLSDYDLNNEFDVDLFLEDKNEIDVYKLTSKYDYESPERYFIENSIGPVISSVNSYKYRIKDEEYYNEAKAEYDALVARLDNFDWKILVNEKIDNYNKKLEELKAAEGLTEREKYEVDNQIRDIEIELEGLNYRLKHNIPFAYTNASYFIEDYVSISKQYASINKDAVKTRNQIIEENEIISSYNEAKYKLENGLVSNKELDLNESLIAEITSSKMYVFIAFLIIAGGIFAEEFNKGTIKQLLVKPFTRTQIFVSKIIAAGIGTLIFTMFLWLAFTIHAFIMTGAPGDIFNPVVVYDFNNEAIVEYNVFTYLLIDMLVSLPHYIILAGICVLMGVWFTNTVSAVISSLGIEIFSELVILLPEKMQAFIPFRCWEFSEFLFGNISSNQYVSLPLSILICSITIIVLYGLSLIIFKKKDIKNQ